MRTFSDKEIQEMAADAERARQFRDFSTSSVWKKYLEPFLYSLQQDAEASALNSFRSGKPSDVVIIEGAVASGRAQATEEFVKFIIRGINDSKESEKRLKELEDAKKQREAAK